MAKRSRKVKRSAAVQKADMWLSRYIRKSAANVHGEAQCFTCGRSHPWQELQCGHFQTRAKYSIRWSEMNVACQCVRCNISNGGQQYQFGINLDRKYGAGTAEKVMRMGNELRKWTTNEILEIAEEYRIKFNDL